MKERPILFNGAMVRALLDGSKTQTRRVFKAKNGAVWPHKNDLPGMRQILRNCPYGQPGDRLWVREAWRTFKSYDALPPRDLLETCTIWREADATPRIDRSPLCGKLRPSMFMPRWASRITLEIVSVRVERLQDISEADASGEGLRFNSNCIGPWSFDGGQQWLAAREAYRELWNSINGPGSWAANPWVWVVEFKRLAA